MTIETGRSDEEQSKFESILIADLERADLDTNNWGDKEAPEVYRTRFVDTMIRIQAGDIHSVEMDVETDPAGNEVVLLRLPVITPPRRDWVKTLTYRISQLERFEPNIRDLLPPLSEEELVSKFGRLHADNQFYARYDATRKKEELTKEEILQREQIRTQLQELAALTIPRILAGELEGIGLERTPGAKTISITLFEGQHRVPVGINSQIRELLPEE